MSILEQVRQTMTQLGYNDSEWCIAGGAAVTAEPRDVDIWIFRKYTPEQEDPIADLGPFQVSYAVPGNRNYPFSTRITVHSLFVSPAGRPVPGQFIFCVMDDSSTLTNPEALLQDFDLSVHAAALLPDGTVLKHAAFTHPRAPIRVLRWTTPHSTLRRYFVFTARYGSDHNWAEIERLCHEVVRVAEDRK